MTDLARLHRIVARLSTGTEEKNDFVLKCASPVRVVLGTMTFAGQTSKQDAASMIRSFVGSSLSFKTAELDSARMYCGGQTEVCIGEILAENVDLAIPGVISLASKANPFFDASLTAVETVGQCEESLVALQVPEIDVFYLHAPDAAVPIEDTLRGVQLLFEDGKFKRFALSNFTAWETVWIHGYMLKKAWVVPTIYQGMYNSITRTVESELLPALRRLGMSFYAYNPLAGGMLTGKYDRAAAAEATLDSGRFNSGTVWGKLYQARFMQDPQFDALDKIVAACATSTCGAIPPAEASLRWIMHHSALSGASGDGIILGASSVGHFEQNMAALAKGPLPDDVVAAFDLGWKDCSSIAPSYSRGYSGSEPIKL